MKRNAKYYEDSMLEYKELLDYANTEIAELKQKINDMHLELNSCTAHAKSLEQELEDCRRE